VCRHAARNLGAAGGALVAEAGLSDSQIEEVAFTWHFADADDYWDFLMDAAGAIAMVLGGLTENERGGVHEQIAEQVAPFHGSSGIELPALSLVASAS